MSKYPECEKLSALSDEFHAVMEFTEFLSGKGYWIGEMGEFHLDPVDKKPELLFYELHGIDLVKLETERQALLEAARNLHKS